MKESHSWNGGGLSQSAFVQLQKEYKVTQSTGDVDGCFFWMFYRLTDLKNLLMTPFERNLSVWRQLWRTIERSQLIVQIVDARNPLVFRCSDLEKYVDQHHLLYPELRLPDGSAPPKKKNLVLLNKADLLTRNQRCVCIFWC